MAEDKRQASINLLLKVLQAAEYGDEEAIATVRKHHASFAKALPLLEEHMRKAAPGGQADPAELARRGVPAAGASKESAGDAMAKNMRDLLLRLGPQKVEMAAETITASAPASKPAPVKRTPLPNTVVDSYGHPIDSPAQQMEPTNDPVVANKRAAEGQRLQAGMRERFEQAASMQAAPSSMSIEPAPESASAETQLARQLLKTLMTVSGKPLK